MTRRRQKWSVQLDQYPPTGQKMYGPRTIIESTAQDRSYASNIGLPNTEVDEILIDRWFHLEAMDVNNYWMNVGGLSINVQIDGRTGKAKSVSWDVEDPQSGTSYEGGAA